MTNTKLFLLFTIIVHFVTQNTCLLLPWNVIDIKYQCNYPGCSPSTTVFASTLENCKMACLNNAGCRTVTFDSNSNQCGLFSNSPDQNCKLISQESVASMTTTDDKQLSTRK